VELQNKGGVQDQATGNPGTLLRTVPLPIDQVLKPTSSAAHIQQLPDGVSRVIIDDPWGWGGNGWGAQRAYRHRLYLGDVKCRVNAE